MSPQHSPTAPIDAEARQRALDARQSFAVAAPAGSGKTGLLTHRILKLLLTVESPEEVLAITFTNKAASEMQERLLAALEQARDAAEPRGAHEQALWHSARAVLQRDRELNWQLLHNPNRLRVQTIDGLCRSIASQLPFDSQLGAIPATLEDAQGACAEAARVFLQGLEQEADYRDDLIYLCRHLDNNLEALQGLFVALLQKREQWLGPIFQASSTAARQTLEASLQQLCQEHLEQLSLALAPVASDLCGLLDSAASYLHEHTPEAPLAALVGIKALPEPSPEHLPRWRLMADFLLTGKGDWRKSVSVKQGVPAGAAGKPRKAQFAEITSLLQESPEALTLLRELKTLPSVRYSDPEWQVLACLTRLLPQLAAQLWLTFAQLGATDFTQVMLAALQALGDSDAPSELALKLDYQIKHILVDEFQDTSLPQLQLLEKLTAGWQPDDGRTMFIVGDGMQSCYGFRNANVGLFLQARREGIGQVALRAVDLQVNFRSYGGIVDWVNHTFAAAFPAADDISRGAVSYTASHAFKAAQEGAAARLYLCPYAPKAEQDAPGTRDLTRARTDEARAVVALVQRAQARNPQGSIAILGRSRGHLQETINQLGVAGIAYQANAIDSLASRMVIRDLTTLTRALLRPDDRLAWLALLRAPWCGLDLHDLHALAHASNPRVSYPDTMALPFIWQQLAQHEHIAELSGTGQRRLKHLLKVCEQARHSAARLSLRQWLYGVWVELGGPATLLNDTDHDDAAQFFSLLEQYDCAGAIEDWTGFERSLGKLFAVPMSAPDTAEQQPAVQIMTMHKSKGLEFDTVIIPGLDRSSRPDGKSLLLWRERLNRAGEPQLLLGPLAPAGEDHGALYQHLKEEQRLQDQYEATRLLYVGCTRAIERLYLLGCCTLSADAELSEAKPAGMLQRIWPQVSESAQPVSAVLTREPSHSAAPTDAARGFIRRLAPQWQPPAAADNPRLAHLRGREHTAEDNIPTREPSHSRQARVTGTVIHSIYEALTQQALPEDTQQYCQAQDTRWSLLLQQHGTTPEALPSALAQVQHAIARTLNSAPGRWVLSHHRQAASESGFISRSGQQFAQHVIDRTFIAEGTRWIIDYKTSQPQPEQSQEAFIAELIEAYQPQLRRYQQLFVDHPEPIATALYCPFLAEPAQLIRVTLG
jgi:ATP-dependent exoDNAse (exonuclease V) beta subunit